MRERLAHMERAAVVVAVLGIASPLGAADLQARTVAAFDKYVRLTEARMRDELSGGAPYLQVDGLPAAERRDVYARLSRGEVVIRPRETMERGRGIEAPDGMIHHWTGIVFIPRTTLERTIAMVKDYERYSVIYRPAVRRSRTLAHHGNRFKAYLQLYMKKVVSVVLNTSYDVEYIELSARRQHVRSYATRIAEVEHPDTSAEREKPVGHDSGYMWRLNNYCSFEGKDGGTYMQCESISLSRDIPVGLGWLIRPFVTSIPRESLTFTLESARRHLTSAP